MQFLFNVPLKTKTSSFGNKKVLSLGDYSDAHNSLSMKFKLNTPFSPSGDQPQAIQKLVEGIQRGEKSQCLLGVTGSGKTFTMANVIAQVQKPTIILSHNKTLTAQLYGEFCQFFPDNAVEYFVSYYD